MDFVGRNGDAVLLSSEDIAVIVDEGTNTVLETGSLSALTESLAWDSSGVRASDVSFEIATAAVTDLEIHVFAENDRMYTIPKAVQSEAKRGLEWRKSEGRGGTSVGVNTARTLADGGQIGIKKVRHIAKYFPRHEVDKKGTGYKPGQENYPSNGRIAWALWGGDAGWRWADAIVEREDAKSASNFEMYEDAGSVELNSFVASADSADTEFFIRLFTDGSGFDRIYLRGVDNCLSVWERGYWSDLGESFTEFSQVDDALDSVSPSSQYFYAPVDPDAALVASAFLDNSPSGRAYVSQLNEQEAAIAASALSELDWDDIDSITAAGPADGYTPAERAAEVADQPRDASGKFGGGGSSSTPAAPAVSGKKYEGSPLDVSGILGQPRATAATAGARLADNTLPPLTSSDIQALLNDWPTWVADQRKKFNKVEIPQVDVNTDAEDVKVPNAFNDPYLRKWLDKKVKGKGGSYYPNRSWYNPIRTDDVQGKMKSKNVYQVSSIVAAAGENITPATSDVPPIYMAVVSPDDAQAVMDLICLIPASTTSTEPNVFTYSKGKWEADSGMLRDLKSPTPPPVVVLDDDALKSVVGQISMSKANEDKSEKPVTASIDSVLAQFVHSPKGMLPVTAAGGADRNRGNAEKLRRYWTVGEGGAKIRWGTGGDWTRCVRQLSKYLGPRAKGYCALRHKEMTGLWTGDKAHKQMYGRKGNGVLAMSDEMLLSSEAIIDAAPLRARKNEIVARVVLASGGFGAPEEVLSHGSKFYIPLVVPEGIETGDGRKFSKESITMRELPLPLMWQIKTDEGHYGSVVVGRIDTMERTDMGIGNAYGVFDNGDYGREAERLVRGGFIRGISADLDKFEADEDQEDAATKDKKGQGKILISKARVMGVTLVPKPAFQECTIQLVKESNSMDTKEQDALVACASVVASIPVVPPRGWFSDPKLTGPTPLTVSDDGRVFGHIAAWHVDHIGLSMGTKPPRSRTGYSYFHTGVLRCDDGADVPVGQLTLAGGHASLQADARSAAKHYDDTGSAFADVFAGEDAYGIWVAGSLRPEVTALQVRAIRASAPSGDWRPIQGNLELVAVCQVNVPGFPIARARVASGQVYALVAAGASYLARLKEEPELVLQAAEEAKARFASLKQEMGLVAGGGCGCCESCIHGCAGNCCGSCMMSNSSIEPVYMTSLKNLLADLVGFYFRAHGYHWNVTGEDFAQYHALFGEIYADVYGSVDPLAENIRKLGGFPAVSLKEYAESSSLAGSELVGGSPKALAADLLMANESLVEELKAVFSLMDASNEQGVADFIAGRIDSHQRWSWQLASSLTPEDIIIVENENIGDIFEAVFSSLEQQGLVASSGTYGDLAYISEEVRMKAAEKGFALPDGSFPIRNVKDLKNAIQAYGRAKASNKAKVRSHIVKRAKALGHSDLIPETFKAASIESEELSALKMELSARVHSVTAAVPAAAGMEQGGVEPDPKALVKPMEEMPEAPMGEEVSPYATKYTPKTQPRDAQGKFRDVLARLKMDLGEASLNDVANKVADVQNLDNAGDYSAAAQGARDVIDVVSRIDSGALDATSLGNVRAGATALAEAISNLPLPFKNQSQKIRYSDVPPALRDLMDDMIAKVEAKIGKDDAKVATENLEKFRSGSEVFSQGEISSEMNKLLRLLT
jgi:DNA-binding ferritin-like protein